MLYSFSITMGVLCLIETLCCSYFMLFKEFRTCNAGIYFATGLAICFMAFYAAVKQQVNDPSQSVFISPKWLPKIKFLLSATILIYVSVLFIQFGIKLFAHEGIDYRLADMLPLIKEASARWLSNQKIYTPVLSVWGGEEIPYLPAMWMPFIPTVWLNVDIRWTTIALTVLSFAIILFMQWKLTATNFLISALFIFTGLFVFSRFHTFELTDAYRLSQEGVPLFFYILLCLAITTKQPIWIGIGFSLCLLSRYAVFPLVPFYLVLLLTDKNYKQFFMIIATMTVVIFGLFVIPYFIERPVYFLNIPFNYLAKTEGFWRAYDYSLADVKGLGLSYLFGYKNLALQRILYNLLLIVIPIAWLVTYVFIRKKQTINTELWVLAGIKLILLIMYNFLPTPYMYLFFIPTLVSYPIYIFTLQHKQSKSI